MRLAPAERSCAFGGMLSVYDKQRDRNAMKKAALDAREAAESVAIAALAYIAGEPEQLGRFLAITGIGPDQIRQAAREPRFLAGVLEHVMGDERLLMAFAEQSGIEPATIGKAQEALGGRWEREVP
jgi:hypothetical protein